jgi:hypothetical protein
MWAITLIVAAFMLGLVTMSLSFSGGGVTVAVPVAIVAIVAAGLFDLRRRTKQARLIHEHREQAKTKKVDFTQRDRETLLSE